ncbi:hypothetical protein MMC25_005235 [Agyrium rufum]|nr:hypothetical protein [Agyrium rufum]
MGIADSLKYARPAYREPCASLDSMDQYAAEKEAAGKHAVIGVPDALSFDRVVSGGTCPPCTLRDFMNYLIYIERAAENLQFFLWYRDYIKRFDNLPNNEKVLSPLWNPSVPDPDADKGRTQEGTKVVSEEAKAIFKGTNFAQPQIRISEVPANPFYTPPGTPNAEKRRESEVLSLNHPWSDAGSTIQSTIGPKSYRSQASKAFEAMDVKIQPFSIQPYRQEIDRIIAIYIDDGAPRQLNLSSKERGDIMRALAATTHPSALAPILHNVEWSLRFQAHPNFIRWSIGNTNRPRVIFAHTLAVLFITLGFLAAILLTLSSVRREWRILTGLGFFLGVATYIGSRNGMCVVLHGMHHRNLRPWELFEDSEGGGAAAAIDDGASTIEMTTKAGSSGGSIKKSSFDSFGTANSFEDEPWIAKYDKRNVVRKVLDREVWIQEPALRQIQDMIFMQACLAGFIAACVLVGALVAIPRQAKL